MIATRLSVLRVRETHIRAFCGAPARLREPMTPATDARTSSSDTDTMSRNAAAHSHRKAFVRWANSKGKQYQHFDNRQGPNYLDGNSHPFPLNPSFQPRPPLPPSTKEKIHAEWKSGSNLRSLSSMFGISLERLDAVLKLQENKAKWSNEVLTSADLPKFLQSSNDEHSFRLVLKIITWLGIFSLMMSVKNFGGKQLMTSYQDTVTQMLGAVDNQASESEPITNIAIDASRQKFTLVPESADYSPTHAAKELGKMTLNDRRENHIRQFLRKSKFETASAFGKLTASRRAEERKANDDHLNNQESDASRWIYKIRDSTML